MQPTQDYVLLEVPSYDGGLVVPGEGNDVQEAKVLAIGDGVWTDQGTMFPIEKLRVGHTVYIQKFAASDGVFDYKGKKVTLVKAGNIMAYKED